MLQAEAEPKQEKHLLTNISAKVHKSHLGFSVIGNDAVREPTEMQACSSNQATEMHI